MTVWYHQSTILKCKIALQIAGLIALCVALITTLFLNSATYAAPGINQTLSFQGRLLTATGTVVADGYYNIQFKIYKGGTNSGGGTEQWFKSYVNNNANAGVNVKNGYFSVNLGSQTAFTNVDWNDDTLYLSMNIAGNSPSCSNFTACSPDGEMKPMKRITSVPFAINSAQLGGRTADGFIQNGTAPQAGNFNITGTGTAANLQTTSVDTASAGTLTIGGTNATDITMADDVTIAAGKSLTLAGGSTASRPANPSEGTLYFDTDTKQLLVYANGKWQSNHSTGATKVVGTSATGGASSAVASNSPDGADYVNSSATSAQTIINSALSAVSSTGGSVYLMEGTYIIDGSITVPNNVTLIGSGSGTVIKLKNGINANIDAITATDTTTGTGVTVTNLRIDGNKANNSSGTQNGIYFYNMGGGFGGSARQGTKINTVWISQLRNYGILLENSYNSIVSGSHVNASSMGLYIKNGAYMTISGNLLQGNTIRGIYASPINQSTITGNTMESNSQYGLAIDGTSANNTITGNTITTTGTGGLFLSTASDNTISGNRFRNSGGATTNQAIILSNTSTGNTITGNAVTDLSATTTNYAIDIQDAGSTSNYLADNTLGGGTINNQGSGTIYGGQTDMSGNYLIQPAGTVELMKNTNVTGALSASTTVLSPSVDRATAGTLTIGSTNATAITVGRTNANTQTTFLGTALFKPTTGNDTTTAFQIQRANGTAMFTVDSTNQTITFGDPASANKTIISTTTGKVTKYGTARNEKKIALTAEYTGAVLDAGNPGSNNGTMTSGFDISNRMNYYKWTTSQSSNQNYDVVVQVPLPNDFDGWATNPLSVSTYTNNTTNGTITLEVRDSGGTVRCNFASVTPGSNNIWSTNSSACSLSAGTYTAGDYMTLRLRMQSPNGGDVRLGNISLSYLSKE